MWSREAGAWTSAAPEQVWRRWTDVSRWSDWDASLRSSVLHGPFVVGARGELQPVSGPRASFILTEVVPQRAFSNRMQLPLATVDFIHTLEPDPSGRARITHRIVINGLLGPLFVRLMGRDAAETLPAAVAALAQQAEGAPS
ncbi:MAG: SRPBCC family protein [Brevundimonas sp.]|uniref:SRPBCC family protein n=1 Tax=Brevundimonas sp. TaxID=1871086 RepID=UPI0022C7D904|nr:SRPBCC family protein [Brevundimonas sp.]MCZ8194186.1 SRPBCC family protein [Brevundimonas sp.]